MTLNPQKIPPGLPDRIWLVIRDTGERDFIAKEPLEGITEWCRGLDATVTEYQFAAVAHTPSKKEEAPKP